MIVRDKRESGHVAIPKNHQVPVTNYGLNVRENPCV